MHSSFSGAFFLGILVIFVDQLTKFLFASHEEINRGISFGIGLPAIFITILSIVFLCFIAYIGRKRPMLMGVVCGAGLSNLLDRIQYGGVRDWLQLPLVNIRNNIADWIIVLGLGWWIWSEFRNSRRKKV